MGNTPCIIRENARGTVLLSLRDEAFSRRELELASTIDRPTAMDTIRSLRYLAQENERREITLLINSSGGSVVDGLAIYDTLRAMPCPVRTVCLGEASSMAALLLAAGTPGRRQALPNSRVMIHDPLIAGGLGGSALTVDAMAAQLMRIRQQTAEILARHTGHAVAEVLERTATDTWFTAQEAADWGLIDQVLTSWADLA